LVYWYSLHPPQLKLGVTVAATTDIIGRIGACIITAVQATTAATIITTDTMGIMAIMATGITVGEVECRCRSGSEAAK